MQAYLEALKALPHNTQWLARHGHIGQAGCVEYYITPQGQKWIVFNNPTWTAKPVVPLERRKAWSGKGLL